MFAVIGFFSNEIDSRELQMVMGTFRLACQTKKFHGADLGSIILHMHAKSKAHLLYRFDLQHTVTPEIDGPLEGRQHSLCTHTKPSIVVF